MSADAPAPRRCGFVAILGAPNAGKSTLVNRVVGQKISIVSPKVQTTRARVRGVVLRGPVQIVFVDTPGIFEPRRRLDRAMVRAAWTSARDADVVLMLADAPRIRKMGDIDDDTARIIEGVRDIRRPVLLAINKVDAVKREALLAISRTLNDAMSFEETFMISALSGDGVEALLDALAARMPEGPWLYPEDQVSDQPLRFFAAEVTREKLYLMLRQEVPYQATVETDLWTENLDGSVRIDQTIYVQRDGQRVIVLGKGGWQIRAIGQAAREELERLLERRVHLFLHVKTRENWDEEREHYRPFDLEFDV